MAKMKNKLKKRCSMQDCIDRVFFWIENVSKVNLQPFVDSNTHKNNKFKTILPQNENLLCANDLI